LHRVRAELDRGHLMLLEERDRIARELNDIVLQRLFAAELRLDALRSLCSPQVQERLAQVIEHLDETNHQVRAAIFEHQAGGHT
jgi:signal transduction histidine kinase